MKLAVLQDPRRYFEQTSTGVAAGPEFSTSGAAALDQMSTTDVLRMINPRSLQSGMDPAAAKQVILLLCKHYSVAAFDRGPQVCDLIIVSEATGHVWMP